MGGDDERVCVSRSKSQRCVTNPPTRTSIHPPGAPSPQVGEGGQPWQDPVLFSQPLFFPRLSPMICWPSGVSCLVVMYGGWINARGCLFLFSSIVGFLENCEENVNFRGVVHQVLASSSCFAGEPLMCFWVWLPSSAYFKLILGYSLTF